MAEEELTGAEPELSGAEEELSGRSIEKAADRREGSKWIRLKDWLIEQAGRDRCELVAEDRTEDR